MKRKNIVSNLRELKANSKNLKNFEKKKYIGTDGVAQINVYADKSSIYNPLSSPEDPDISDDVISYIDDKAYYIPVEYPIRVVIHSHDDLNDKQIEKKLKENYWKKLADKDNDLRKNKIISFILFFIGILLLSVYFILKSLPQTKDLFNEISSIAASFAIWESVDYALLSRGALRIEYMNIAQLALLTVEISDNE